MLVMRREPQVPDQLVEDFKRDKREESGYAIKYEFMTLS